MCKIHSSFITNSSSSSFVIIGRKKLQDIAFQESILVAGSELGKIEFGWGPETIRDWGSRVNFAYLQTLYLGENGKQKLEMLEKILRECLKVKEITWKLTMDEGYIDHQSSAIEGENLEIFESEELLRQFLFAEDSKIVLNNDNY